MRGFPASARLGISNRFALAGVIDSTLALASGSFFDLPHCAAILCGKRDDCDDYIICKSKNMFAINYCLSAVLHCELVKVSMQLPFDLAQSNALCTRLRCHLAHGFLVPSASLARASNRVMRECYLRFHADRPFIFIFAQNSGFL